MPKTLAFDVYGTLINTHGVVAKLEEMIGDADKALMFSNTWREKQLEYSFRRGLMQNYQPFSVCTCHALDYTCLYYQLKFTQEQKQALLNAYKTLPAFDDVQAGLAALKSKGYCLFAFSNGTAAAVEMLLEAADIRSYFDGVVSVDEMKSFKPNPAVYSHFLRQSESTHAEAWLVSSNPFDVIGALSAGMRSAWVQRSKRAIFDPWGVEPTLVVSDLTELETGIID